MKGPTDVVFKDSDLFKGLDKRMTTAQQGSGCSLQSIFNVHQRIDDLAAPKPS
jgi:hypothetical protein